MPIKKKPIPSQDYLASRLSYDPESGLLTWKPKPVPVGPSARTVKAWNTNYAGTIAGSKRGYAVIVVLDNSLYGAHRLIWMIAYGEMPPDHLHIDHIDRDPYNNKLDNLRILSHQHNLINAGMFSHNTSGYRGVTRNKRDGTWAAQISCMGKRIHVGYYSTPEMASIAREIRIREMFPDVVGIQSENSCTLRHLNTKAHGRQTDNQGSSSC